MYLLELLKLDMILLAVCLFACLFVSVIESSSVIQYLVLHCKHKRAAVL